MASRIGPSNSRSAGSSARPCLCSPSTHPGSFRCSFHRSRRRAPARSPSAAAESTQWEAEMAAKANALKAILLQIIKPSGGDHRRRKNFHPKPSRFCLMNDHGDGLAVS